jgi:hypothetical protein
MRIMDEWSAFQSKQYGSHIQTFRHYLRETGLFEDDALAALLDRHPTELIDVCTMTHHPDFPDRHSTVDFRGCSGADLITLAKEGRLWINVREAMSRDPEYMAVMDRTYAELAENSGEHRIRHNCRGGILISSPTAKVPYHCDPTVTLLWHIRGQKRVFVYPTTETFRPEHAYEAILLGEEDQDLPYQPEFEKEAKVFDLEPGTLVSWPHTSPHRVENQTFCISMVMEFSTYASSNRNACMYVNGLMRRRLGQGPSYEASHLIERALKIPAGHALRRLGAHKDFIRQDWVRFKLDGETDEALRAIEPVLRDF